MKTFDIVRTRWFRVYLAWGGCGLLNFSFWRKTYRYTDHGKDPPEKTECVDFEWHLHLLQVTDWGQYGDSKNFSWNVRGYDGWDTSWNAGPFGSLVRQNG